MYNDRYEMKKGSVSGHCCFEASVVDTTEKPSKKEYIICECYSVENAELITKLLNNYGRD